MYVDRDAQGNIVSIYARPQNPEGHEFLEKADLIAALKSQPLQWDHGYS